MKRKRWRGLASTAAVAGGTILWACTMVPEDVGSSAQALEAGMVGSNNGQGSSEVWAAWSPAPIGFRGPDTLVINYNINNFRGSTCLGGSAARAGDA